MEPRRPPTRRHFLSGRAALEALQHAATEAALGPAEERSSRDRPSPFAPLDVADSPYLMRYTRAAMASDFQLFLVAGYPDDAAATAIAALDMLEPLEAQLTIYREVSEVLEINRCAADEPVEVEPRLFALLKQAVDLFHETGGAYDITSGPLSEAWGFSRRQGAIPSEAELAAALARVGGNQLVLDDLHHTVRFAKSGVEINVNSCGKGFALDRVGEFLREQGIEHFLWHGGQSSVLAYGSANPGLDPGAGWAVGIGHPLRTEQRLAEVIVRNGAAGTSGAGFQFFRHDGKRYGHILDPRTGRPAEGVFSVTVLAPTAAQADALSTAFYVLGFEESTRVCERHPEIGFLMLMPSAGGGAIELATCGLADDQWRLVGRSGEA